MRVQTQQRHGLEVERADSDGDVFIGTKYDGFYINRRDVQQFIRVLRWAIRVRKHGVKRR